MCIIHLMKLEAAALVLVLLASCSELNRRLLLHFFVSIAAIEVVKKLFRSSISVSADLDLCFVGDTSKLMLVFGCLDAGFVDNFVE